VLEYDGSSGAIQHWYTYGIGANAVLNQTNVIAATRTALIPDVQGSIIATLDSAAGALTKTGYLPYGQSANPPSSFGYTSQRIDPETNGLYYYRTRHYSAVLGRFLQTDPSGYRGGKNLYANVNNDPLNNTDRRGLAQDEPDEDENTGIAASAGGTGGGGGAQAPPPPGGEDPDDEENEPLALPAPAAGTVQAWSGPITSGVVPDGGIVAFRIWGGDIYQGGSAQVGSWLSPIAPESSSAAQSLLSLPPGNTAQFISPVFIPAGTQIQFGTAAAVPEFGTTGGGIQIQLLERIAASNFGPGTPLPP
jgi:RHS repeat-associated protein